MNKGQCTKTASFVQQVKHLQEVFANNSPEGFNRDYHLHDACYHQIQEELLEYERDIVSALIRNDGSAEKETRDWIVDMMFYLLQYAYKVGVADKIADDFYKIYLNNVTKATDKGTAELSRDKYVVEGVDCEVVENRFGDWVVKRLVDGKVLKPIRYESVEL